jgi:hypothetical protein
MGRWREDKQGEQSNLFSKIFKSHKAISVVDSAKKAQKFSFFSII